MAGIASEVWGRPIRRLVITDEEQRAGMAARGLPPVVADITLGLYRANRSGEFATVDPTLERLLGRPPISLRDFIVEKAGHDPRATGNSSPDR